MEQTCVVVGGGLAGATAAFTLRSQGFTGRIVVVCEENRRPYSKPELSKKVLRGEFTDDKTRLRPDDFYDKQSIELLLGRPAVDLDVYAQVVRLADGETIHYDQLLLATGGRPRMIPGTENLPGVFAVRTLDDTHALSGRLGEGRSLLVVGGGFIGAEVAASARALGTAVTVLEAEAAPLSRLLPPLLSDTYAKLHRERGVTVLVGTGVERLEVAGEGVVATDTQGGRHYADTVVVAIGLVPNVELAQRAGLAVDNGIVVDEYCRTSVPNVYAVGDVANYPNHYLGGRVRIEHWQNAQHQAMTAARNMLGAAEAFAEVPWVWSDQYEVNLQIAGVPRPDDDVVVRGDIAALKFSAFLLRDGALVAAIGLNRPTDVQTGRLLIAQGARPDPDVLRDECIALASLVEAPVPA